MNIFFEIHSDLPRQGPGSGPSTRRAYRLLPEIRTRPEILDIGCGPGAQTIELARISEGEITAVDNHQPHLEELRRRAEREGMAERIRALPRDMFDLKPMPAPFDLVWCEGAIYIMGFEAGLTAWRGLLRAGGHMAVSEATWLKSNPPPECQRFWREEYPAMTDVPGNLAMIRKCGYEVIGHFTLPESDWWDEYYMPLEERLSSLRRKYKGVTEALELIESTQVEIDFFRQFSDYYGYVFYVMRLKVSVGGASGIKKSRAVKQRPRR